jgi:hypothetical protein
VRVSQVQLIQRFLAPLFGVPILGERLDAITVAFSLAVMPSPCTLEIHGSFPNLKKLLG